ncbi:hypothetical protein [Paraglaciecola aestuariivivens]
MKKTVSVSLVVVGLGVWLWQLFAEQPASLPKPSQSAVEEAKPLAPQQPQSPKQQTMPTDKQEQTVDKAFYQARLRILADLDAARLCQQSGQCEADLNDPKAAMFEQEKRLVESLQSLQALYQEYQIEDQVLTQTIDEFIASPLGRVQFQALQMMQQQPPNIQNAQSLISALDNSYDSKVMALALQELIRYPSLAEQIDELLISNLQTGSFYVSRTIAQEISAYLNANNIAQYQALANSLPQNMAKTKLLQSALNEYQQN